jgi:hypothetical protein
MKIIQQIIAYGLTQEEATATHRHLISTMACAPENITIITDPAAIFSLRASEVNLVGVKAHATDQQQWSKLMPICRYMKENNIKFQIIK